MDDREDPRAEKAPAEKTERVTIGLEESKTGEIAAVCFLDGYRTALRDIALLAFAVTLAMVLARTFFEGEK